MLPRDGRRGGCPFSRMGRAVSNDRAARIKAPLNTRKYPPNSCSGPLTLVPITFPAEATKARMALARIACWGGKRLLKATVSGTQVPAASPVMARPANSPPVPWALPITQAPRPAKAIPARMKGLRRPSQSAAMPTGKRMMACHSPYWARTTPTTARLPLLLSM